jgi:hypothetical protein
MAESYVKQWLVDHQSNQLTPYIYHDAVKASRRDVIEYLHQRGIPYDEFACYWAASRDLDMLQWLRGLGFCWDQQRCHYIAKMMDHPDIVTWIEAQN